MTESKLCSVCNLTKSLTEFNQDKTRRDGLQYYCRLCNHKYYKRYNKSIDGRYSSYKSRASQDDILFELTKDQFASFWKKPCVYCGLSVKGVGIDRIDNSQGYTFSNSAPCCGFCNQMKNSKSVEEFITHIHRIAAHYSGSVS